MLKIFPLLLFVFLLHSTPTAAQEHEFIDWNDKGLKWLSYEEGLKQLKQTNGVGILVIYGEFCHICKAYAKLFQRADVIASLQDIVLIRVDVSEHPSISERYDLDGEYVPRTFALDSNGDVSAKMHQKRAQFSYVMPFEEPQALMRFAKNLKFYKGEVNKAPDSAQIVN